MEFLYGNDIVGGGLTGDAGEVKIVHLLEEADVLLPSGDFVGRTPDVFHEFAMLFPKPASHPPGLELMPKSEGRSHDVILANGGKICGAKMLVFCLIKLSGRENPGKGWRVQPRWETKSRAKRMSSPEVLRLSFSLM